MLRTMYQEYISKKNCNKCDMFCCAIYNINILPAVCNRAGIIIRTPHGRCCFCVLHRDDYNVLKCKYLIHYYNSTQAKMWLFEWKEILNHTKEWKFIRKIYLIYISMEIQNWMILMLISRQVQNKCTTFIYHHLWAQHLTDFCYLYILFNKIIFSVSFMDV